MTDRRIALELAGAAVLGISLGIALARWEENR